MNFSSTRFFKRFALDHRGSLTIQFAFIMIPMIAFSGIAIDYSKAMGIKKQLQDIADSTVIAGARLPATTSQKRLDEAHHLLAAALANTSLEDVKTNIQATNANVRIEASYNYKTSLMGILGVENMQIAVKSAAQSQVENGGVACLIALNETIDDGLHLQGINKVSSRNCWTWVNSDSSSAINATGTSMGTGQGFCSHGGAVGAEHFDPQCDRIGDPFASKWSNYQPENTTCEYTDQTYKNGIYTMRPGVYCGNTVLKPQADVRMMPGLYVFRGGYLEVQGQASLSGDAVTLYFDGNNTRMIVRGGGNIDIKAPDSGEFAGFVMMEPNAADTNIRETIIQGGGRIKMEGVLYAPYWRVSVSGNGDINETSKYFAMIANHYYMEGNGSIYIQSNAESAQLPDLMPRIKTGPRLLY